MNRVRLAASATLAVAATALIALGAAGGWGGTEADGVPLHEVRRGPFIHEVTAEGNLQAVDSTTLTVPVSSVRSYTIAWVAPDASRVKRGDVVVRFDRTELEKELADGRSDEEKSRNDLRKHEAEAGTRIANLERDVEVATLTREAARSFKPQDDLLYSRREIIEGEIDAELAKAKVEHSATSRDRREEEAVRQREIIEIERRRAHTSIERAEEGLAAMEVVAPHDGIVLLQRDWSGPIRAGKSVWQGQELAKIPDLSRMEAEVHVLEADAGGLEVGKAASVTIEAHPEREFAATIARVDELAKPRVRGVPVQYFGATLEIERSDPEIMKPGQRVRARLRLIELEDVLVIPRQAIFRDEGRSMVKAWRDGRFVDVPVTLGAGSPGRVVVEEGLEQGDRIALGDPARTGA